MKNDFVFAIPMISRKNCENWDRAIMFLNATLASVLNQNDGNFRVLIAANDDIRNLISRDERIQIVLFGNNHDAAGNTADLTREQRERDSGNKKHIMTNIGMKLGAKFVMYLDADDLVRSDLVEVARKENHPVGYLLGSGYIENAATGKMLLCPDNQIINQPFDTLCGSSVVLRYPAPPRHNWDFMIMGEGHHKVRQKLMESDTPALSLTDPMCIYRLNTGINMTQHISNPSQRLQELNALLSEVNEKGHVLNDHERRQYGLPSRDGRVVS